MGPQLLSVNFEDIHEPQNLLAEKESLCIPNVPLSSPVHPDRVRRG
jgi:hypothetical protein